VTSLASSRVFCGLKASAFVTAQLGPGPNEGLVVIVTRSFLTKPRMFYLVHPHIMLGGFWYKLVELMCGPWVSAQ
jgi:hypothetical protein